MKILTCDRTVSCAGGRWAADRAPPGLCGDRGAGLGRAGAGWKLRETPSPRWPLSAAAAAAAAVGVYVPVVAAAAAAAVVGGDAVVAVAAAAAVGGGAGWMSC